MNLFEEAHKRALEFIKTATIEERVAILKDAGVLDENGRLAKRYRPEKEDESSTDSNG